MSVWLALRAPPNPSRSRSHQRQLDAEYKVVGKIETVNLKGIAARALDERPTGGRARAIPLHVHGRFGWDDQVTNKRPFAETHRAFAVELHASDEDRSGIAWVDDPERLRRVPPVLSCAEDPAH